MYTIGADECEAPPDTAVANTVCARLAPEQIVHPVYANLIDVHFEIEMEDQIYSRPRQWRRARSALRDLERSLEPLENNGPSQSQNTVKLTSSCK